ncbi:phiSA1p31-related protein [Streptomyces sp. NPDC092296]|uniref:phiSA1p31-related protein n=1 Tax=Streptomyces sp. NPDC092296 TaxID=3366012 RepID=UPI0037F23D8B
MSRDRLHVNHFAEAERCLSQASRRRSDLPDAPFVNPESAAVLASMALAHAALAHLPEQAVAAQEQVKELRAERDALHSVIVGHVFEALTSASRETRKFAKGIATELDRAGVNIDDAIFDRSERTGYGPHHYTVDGVLYELRTYVDDEGAIWEPTGHWTPKDEPLMGVRDGDPWQRLVPFTELVRTRGPLKKPVAYSEEPPF